MCFHLKVVAIIKHLVKLFIRVTRLMGRVSIKYNSEYNSCYCDFVLFCYRIWIINSKECSAVKYLNTICISRCYILPHGKCILHLYT